MIILLFIILVVVWNLVTSIKKTKERKIHVQRADEEKVALDL